jgi:hypothetical protein
MSNGDQARSPLDLPSSNVPAFQTVHSHAPCALPLRPVILGGHPMKQAHYDYDAAIPSSTLPARGRVGRRVSRVTDHESRVTNHV